LRGVEDFILGVVGYICLRSERPMAATNANIVKQRNLWLLAMNHKWFVNTDIGL
jgi:hypothetical protein